MLRQRFSDRPRVGAAHYLGLLLALLLAVTCAPMAATAASSRHPRSTETRTVSFDPHSLMIDGRRTFIWSGEFHPFRLPSPSLWRDVLEKMKADGYDAVSIYFDWGYHSPKSGIYDLHGVRDPDKVLDIAQQVGLYVIARPGPYVNGELDAGGFPEWLLTQAGPPTEC